ncbi:MAG: hypothetical protein KDA24_02240 [Deltaproteobacteria bacterium]|nr:hypothetical protein [Deltaproteobacteria bacterium]
MPSYAELLTDALAGWPRVVWGADAARSLGRAPWLGELLGPALHVYGSASHAPAQAERVAGAPGVVRRVDDLALEMVGLGGGLLLGPGPGRESLGGVPVRDHDLGRPLTRLWALAETAIRVPEPGIDVLRPWVGVATGSSLRSVGVSRGALFAPEGTSLLVTDASTRDLPTAEEIGAFIGSLAHGEDADGAWVIGSADAPDLVGDLVAVGAIEHVRPAWGVALVADAHRFRSPFVDAHGAWRALAEQYAAALPEWSLAERTKLGLNDQSPRDLIALAQALNVRPSLVGEVLMDLDAADLVAARLERPLIEARPGPRWDASPEDLATAIAASHEGTIDWMSSDGCRTVAWLGAAGFATEEPCGACEFCDPTGMVLASKRAAGASSLAMTMPATDAPRRGQASLDALFTGLGSAESASAPAAPRLVIPTGEELSAELLAAEPEAIAERVRVLGGAAVSFVLSVFRHQGPNRNAAPGAGEATALVKALSNGQAPWVGLPEGVAQPRPGTWTVDATEGRWTFVRRRGGAKVEARLLQSLAGIEDDDLARYAAARAFRGALNDALKKADSALVAALNMGPGVPDAPESIDAARAALASLGAILDSPCPKAPELIRALDRDAESLELLAKEFFSKKGSTVTAGRLAARAWLASGGGTLSASELLRWWERDRAALADEVLGPIIENLSSARRSDIAALRVQVGEPFAPALLEAALRLKALPREFVVEALVGADPKRIAQVLVAASPDARRARRLWAELSEGLRGVDEGELGAAFAELPGAVAAALAQSIASAAEAREQRAAARQEVLVLAEQGRLGEAASRLAELPEEALEPELAASLADVRRRAVERQQQLVGPVAAVLAGLSGDEAEDAGFAALEDAIAEGFGAALVALLSRQHRRTPGDPVRALWLARAQCMSGEWAEGERVYGIAAGLRSDPNARVATEFEGIFMAFEDGESSRALRWLGRALEVPWHQVLVPHVASLVDEGVVPADRRAELAAVLEGTRSPFYGKLIATLRG